MKKMVAAVVALCAASSAFGWPLVRDGILLESPPEVYVASDGSVVHPGGDMAVFLAEGYLIPSLEQVAKIRALAEEARVAAAAEAEAARIAAKPVLLKKAENRFLMALGAFNQQFPANSILPTDGFLEIGDKLKDSGMPLVDRLELSQTLNAYWDLVLFHGGRFGDIQWHPEPEAFPTDMQ